MTKQEFKLYLYGIEIDLRLREACLLAEFKLYLYGIESTYKKCLREE